MDPATGLTILGGAIGGAKVVEKILGPTSEYLGDGLKNWTEKRVENVQRIFSKAQKRIGKDMDDGGSVPPRVLKEILDEGSFCDDEISAEYFGGVLASSRTSVSRDDRGTTYLKLISELSSYQLRLHYILYYWIREIFKGSEIRPNFGTDLDKTYLLMHTKLLHSAMDFISEEDSSSILNHCLSGLGRHDLVAYGPWGNADHINSMPMDSSWRKVTKGGITLAPTQFGIDLWLWAVGAGNIPRTEFLSSDVRIDTDIEIDFSQKPFPLVDLTEE